MKIICPHCGVKGIATEELLEKKVRCPECTKVFRVVEEFLAPADVVTEEPVVIAEEALAENPDVANEAVVEESAPTEEVIEEDLSLSEGVELCSRCGFSFSKQFCEVVGAGTFCSVCANQGPIEEPLVPAEEPAVIDEEALPEDPDVANEAIVEESVPVEEVIKEDVIKEDVNLPEGVELCSRCGFSFSEQFSEVVGTENFCSLCASRRPIAE